VDKCPTLKLSTPVAKRRRKLALWADCDNYGRKRIAVMSSVSNPVMRHLVITVLLVVVSMAFGDAQNTGKPKGEYEVQ
jgi:hypothetical protein